MKLIYRIRPPCPRCPYKLGLIYAVLNPCPRCKQNGYQEFEWFHETFMQNVAKKLRKGVNADENE